MMIDFFTPRYAAALIGAALLGGCTDTSNDLVIQSKFAYPNGDYAALGHVSAEKHYTTFFNTPEMGREIFISLEQQAMASKPGADVIVDYVISSTVTQVPLIPIVSTTFRIDGTALKINEVGGQVYKDGVVPSQTRTR